MDPTAGARLRVGLFPLGGVVLFPGLPLPLHVFEPRYRSLVADALAGDGLIGMVLLRPGWESGYEGRPSIHATGGLGRIVQSHPHPDGKYDIVLQGIGRFTVLEEEQDSGPYRVAVAEVLEEKGPPPGDPDARGVATSLLADVASLNGTIVPEEGLDLGALAGLIASALRLPVTERQHLLEEDDALKRARSLRRLLAPRVARARALDRLIERGGWKAAERN